MFYERTLAKTLEEANKFFKVVLITGPRQVGKTTLFQHLKEPERKYVTLDDPLDLFLAREDPESFFEKYSPPILIDEVQKAPNLFTHIKKIADASDARGQFWLTGSQAFPLMKNISESLAGRVAILNLQGFSQAELQKDAQRPLFLPNLSLSTERPILSKTEIFERILRGAFPQLSDGTPPNLFYSSYVSTYLERDVRAIANIANEANFVKFLKVVAARTGQILNFADISRDVGISTPTVRNWISILATSGLIFLLPPYSRNFTQRAIKSPKIYFTDTGLCCYLNGISSAESAQNGPLSGALFETFVVGEILKSFWHHGENPAAYFFRDNDNNKEIDLLIERDGKLFPIEIKQTSTPNLKMAKHFSVVPASERACGAIICAAEKLSVLSKDVRIVPASFI